MLELVYETHATSTDNEAGIATGWGRCGLSPTGRAQALALGERRRADDLAAVVSSDLPRAVDTAVLAFGGGDILLRQDGRLRECDYGALTGAPASRVAAERLRRVDEPFPGGESYRQVVERTRSFLRELAADWTSGRVLLIAHSANRWALEHLLGGVTLEDAVAVPFVWRPGWEYRLPPRWPVTARDTGSVSPRS